MRHGVDERWLLLLLLLVVLLRWLMLILLVILLWLWRCGWQWARRLADADTVDASQNGLQLTLCRGRRRRHRRRDYRERRIRLHRGMVGCGRSKRKKAMPREIFGRG